MEALTAPSPPALFPRGRGFHSSAIVGFCFREAVALSVPLSPACVSRGRGVVAPLVSPSPVLFLWLPVFIPFLLDL